MPTSLDVPAKVAAAAKLTPTMALCLVAGSMLGAGIFLAPAAVAKVTSTPWSFLALWCVGGLCALAGALGLAELGAMQPRSGGEMAFIAPAFGRRVAWAAGWMQVVAIFPGSLATMSLAVVAHPLPACIRGLGLPVPSWLDTSISMGGPTVVAGLLVVVLTGINSVALHLAGWLQTLTTLGPIALLAVAMAIVSFEPGVATNLRIEHVADSTWSAYVAAYLAVYFAYSGWNTSLYVAGEIHQPAKNLPRSLLGGCTVVVVLYLLLSLGFIAVLGLPTIAQTGEVGTAVAVILFGGAGGTAFAILMIGALLSSINGTIMAGSRILVAMAEQDPRLAWARQRPLERSPGRALWLQAGVALVWLATGRHLEGLMGWTAGAMLITGSLGVGAVVVLRKRWPQKPRPFVVPFYPWPIVIYLVQSLVVLVALLSQGDLAVAVPIVLFLGLLAAGAGDQGKHEGKASLD